MSRFGRSDEGAVGPSAMHRFVEPDENRMGLAMSAGKPDLQMAPALALADASLRERRCAMKGCGKPRQDAIHGAEE